MENSEIAAALEEIGDLLEIKGGNRFKVEAYRRAARSINGLSRSLDDISQQENGLTKIPGIGESIAQKVLQMMREGKITYLEELEQEIPVRLRELIAIPGLGAKKAKLIYDELHVTSIPELKDAINAQKLREIRGLGAKTEENILQGIGQLEKGGERLRLDQAVTAADPIVHELKNSDHVDRVDAAGSLRRMKETIGDIDILAASEDPIKVMDLFCSLPQVSRVLAKGSTKSSVIVKKGLRIDLRVVLPEEYGSALQYFTGSKPHNIKLRGIAISKGLKLNEYGVFKVDTDEKVAGETEEGIYALLGLAFIPPELREDWGEVEAAAKGELPTLVERNDIKGDTHTHTFRSDGVSDIDDYIDQARLLNYEYITISDHAEKLYIAGGLTEDEFRKLWQEIDRINEKRSDILVLKGAELNIDNDGNVDYPTKFLKDFDIVTASVHAGFGQSEKELTRRIIKAMENPHVDIIGHPTGRLIGKRLPYALDIEKVFDMASSTGTFLELNSFPDRLDLRDEYLREAKSRGVKFAIGTDSHAANQLAMMRYGVVTAQRGWLESKDIINCYSWEEVKGMLKA